MRNWDGWQEQLMEEDVLPYVYVGGENSTYIQ